MLNDKIVVGLIQLTNGVYNHLPYSVGLLQAYAQKYLIQPHDFQFLQPLTKRLMVMDSIEHLKHSDILAFSTYVWNMERSLSIAQMYKLENPNTLIVFGGPQVPDRSEEFLRKYPFIDICCHGAGEVTFTEILNRFQSGNWQAIKGISYLNPIGKYINTGKAELVKDLAQIPSPYLSGVFRKLMINRHDEVWHAVWETNRGCPFSCTFCDWGSAVQSKIRPFSIERLEQELIWFAEHRIEYIRVCDANFGLLKRDLEIAQLAINIKKQYGFPKLMSVQNAKNVTERAYRVHQMLHEAGMLSDVTLALQSIDPLTLKNVKRQNIATEFYQELQRRFMQEGINTYTDLILGLPGETYDSFANGISTIIANGQHRHMEFFNLSILPNSEMGDPEYQKLHGIETVFSRAIHMPDADDDVREVQNYVIATHSMPRQDWAKTRAFAWMTSFLHYNNRKLQILLIVLYEVFDIDYRDSIEAFCIESDEFPTISEIYHLFLTHAQAIQNGESEHCKGEELSDFPLDGWFFRPPLFANLKLITERKLENFYRESEKLIHRLLTLKKKDFDPQLIQECLAVNHALFNFSIREEPFLKDFDFDVLPGIKTSFNILEFYGHVIRGHRIPLRRFKETILINTNDGLVEGFSGRAEIQDIIQS